MDHRILGTTLPVLEMQLRPGESVVAISVELSWMRQSIDMHTSTGFSSGGGFMGIIKRVAGGGSLFMTEYTAQGAPGLVAFATRVPGHILPVDVSPAKTYMIHRHGFLCATPGVELSVGFQQSLGAGIFGGDGFLLQKLAGSCQAFIELDGEVVPYDLGPGETLRVHPGHVGRASATCSLAETEFFWRRSPGRAASGCNPCRSPTSPTRSALTCAPAESARRIPARERSSAACCGD